MTVDDFDYSQLAPGIVGAVKFFRSLGYETTDSGDGSAFRAGMEGALEEPMVAMVNPFPRLMFNYAIALHDILGTLLARDSFRVETSYSPSDGVCVLLVTGRGLLNLGEEMSPNSQVVSS